MTECLTVLQGDCLAQLSRLPSASVRCVVTSPPYWGLRDYGVKGQIGLEKTPEQFIRKLVNVFREVRRVLTADGTCWVNMGDCYASNVPLRARKKLPKSVKSKDLIGQPWMLAFALRADGWFLRRDIIWSKPNPMPESAKDRPTTAHEYVFLFSKSSRYFYNAEAIKEPVTGGAHSRGSGINPKCAGWAEGPGAHRTLTHARPGGSYRGSIPGRKNGPGQDRRSTRPRQNESFSSSINGAVEMRNKRSVWNIAAARYTEAHFATYPPALVKPCILAGTEAGDAVLDPFGGSGTTAMVALELGRRAVVCELNPEYVRLIHARCSVTPGLAL